MTPADWNSSIDAAPWRSRAAIGRGLLWVGAAAMLWGVFLTPPWGKLGVAAAAIGCILAWPPVLRGWPVRIGIALSAWILLSTAAAALRGQPGALRIDGLAYAWLAVPLTAAAAADARWRRWALRGLVLAGALATTVALAQFLIGIGDGPLHIDPAGTRLEIARGFSAWHLSFGFAAAVLASLSVPAAAGAAWSWAGRGIALVGLGICGARACLLGGSAAISAALAARGGRWLLAAGAVAILLLGLFAGRMLLTDSDRLASMLAGRDGRWPIWQTTTAMLREQPLLGVGGRDAYKQAYNAAYERALPGQRNEFGADGGCPHAHSWLLALAVERGVPAALLHLTLIAAVVAMLWRRRRQAPEAFQMGCGLGVAALVCGMFEPLPTLAAAGMGFHAALGLALGTSLAAPVSAAAPAATAPR